MATVLIIDDDDMLCKTLTRHISRMGHSIVTSSTLEKGLNEVSSGNIDLVFLDVHLPDGNGLEALPIITQAGSSHKLMLR